MSRRAVKREPQLQGPWGRPPCGRSLAPRRPRSAFPPPPRAAAALPRPGGGRAPEGADRAGNYSSRRPSRRRHLGPLRPRPRCGPLPPRPAPPVRPPPPFLSAAACGRVKGFRCFLMRLFRQGEQQTGGWRKKRGRIWLWLPCLVPQSLWLSLTWTASTSQNAGGRKTNDPDPPAAAVVFSREVEMCKCWDLLPRW